MNLFFVRKIFIHLLTIATYLCSIYALFYETSFVGALFSVALFYASLHFSMVELKHEARLRHFFMILLIAATLLSIFFGIDNFYFIVSIYLYHTGIFFLLRYILEALQNRTRLSTWEIVHIGGYIFTVFMTISFGTLILAKYPTFPFTCEDIYKNSDKVIETVTYPFSVGKETLQHIKANVISTTQLSL